MDLYGSYWFLKIYISQGIVAMQLRCGGIFNNHLIANCLQNVPVKQFWKSVNIWRRYGQWQSGKFFFVRHSVIVWVVVCVVVWVVAITHSESWHGCASPRYNGSSCQLGFVGNRCLHVLFLLLHSRTHCTLYTTTQRSLSVISNNIIMQAS